MTVTDLRYDIELILRRPYSFLSLLPLGRVCLLSGVCCLDKFKAVFSYIAMAGYMGMLRQLLLVFVAESDVWA